MKSMTGYGRATAALGSFTLTVQVSSVNRKTLDLALKLPSGWDALEAAINELVRKVAHRGRISINVELTGVGRGSELAWDEVAVGNALDRLAQLARARGLAFAPTPELIWSVVNSQRQSAEMPDPLESAPVVTAAVGEALRAFAAMRAREGEALLIDFLPRLETLRRQIEVITGRAPLVPAAYREQLLQRLGLPNPLALLPGPAIPRFEIGHREISRKELNMPKEQVLFLVSTHCCQPN